MRYVKILFVVVFSFFMSLGYSNAQEAKSPVYSFVSTSFVLTKTIKCDEVKAKFEVYAEGDTYSMALKRLTNINNNFVNFLRKTFSPKEVQTSNAYGYSKTAMIYVSVKSKKTDKISSVLSYIADKTFQYKTGIKPLYIRFIVSNKLKREVKNALFLEALRIANAKLTVVNSVLSNGYKIGSIDIGENTQYPVLYERNTFRTLYKGAPASSNGQEKIQTSPGSLTVKVNVRLKLIKKID